jgi:hypothetical protein
MTKLPRRLREVRDSDSVSCDDHTAELMSSRRTAVISVFVFSIVVWIAIIAAL